ncbi:MAG: ComEC family competence protein, partial [Alphaproteobacteria bacterium]
MPVWSWASRVFERQSGHLFPWVPVALGAGVGLWLQLPFEPGVASHGAAAAAVLVGAAMFRRAGGVGTRAVAAAVALVAAGFLLAGVRAHVVAAPVLGHRYHGAVEGRIVAIDRSWSDRVRLTLDEVRLDGIAPERTPARVRIALHGAGHSVLPVPGMRVKTTAYLAPPSPPVEPGGFDFRRDAWFRGIGAVGYTRVPVLRAAGGRNLPVSRLRHAIAQEIRAALPGATGGLAAAVAVGDRAGIERSVADRLRAANLSHLLAISGLHMGLLVGLAFGVVRFVLALVPSISLRLDTRRVAAGVALVIAAAYLVLSGANVATERAFIMAAIALIAIMLGRRALTLTAVAVAATAILALWPESLTSPGFQMSFAATVGLVACFEALRDRLLAVPRLLRPAVTLAVASVAAGLATAPIAAAHFNQIPRFGLLANLAAVPAMGTLVMPGAFLAAVLAPLGGEDVGLWLMGLGIRWILWVAEFVAALPRPTVPVPMPPPQVLPLVAVGGLILVLWQGRARVAGAVLLAIALGLWVRVERPPVLISADGRLAGVLGAEGRVISARRGNGFAAEGWLRHDGDGAGQAEAAARPGAVPGRGTA